MKVGDLVRSLNPIRGKREKVGLIVEHEVYQNNSYDDPEEGYWVVYVGSDAWRWELPHWIKVVA
jgi:hypothetical protein